MSKLDSTSWLDTPAGGSGRDRWVSRSLGERSVALVPPQSEFILAALKRPEYTTALDSFSDTAVWSLLRKNLGSPKSADSDTLILTADDVLDSWLINPSFWESLEFRDAPIGGVGIKPAKDGYCSIQHTDDTFEFLSEMFRKDDQLVSPLYLSTQIAQRDSYLRHLAEVPLPEVLRFCDAILRGNLSEADVGRRSTHFVVNRRDIEQSITNYESLPHVFGDDTYAWCFLLAWCGVSPLLYTDIPAELTLERTMELLDAGVHLSVIIGAEGNGLEVDFMTAMSGQSELR